jgi:hypothetical protein
MKITIVVSAIAFICGLLIGQFEQKVPQKYIEVVAKTTAHKVITITKKPTGEVITTIVSDKVIDKVTKKEIVIPKNYFATVQRFGLLETDSYQLSLSKRLYQNFYITGSISTIGKVGLGVSIEF